MLINLTQTERTHEHITFRFGFDPAITNTLRHLPNTTFLPAKGCWGMPYSPLAAWLCLRHFPERSHYAGDTYALLERAYPQHHGVLPDCLYPFQVDGARFLLSRGNAILADCPGAGKSKQAVSAAAYWTPTVITCPPSIQYQWAEEIRSIDPDASIRIVRKRTDKIEHNASWTIISHNLFTSHQRSFLLSPPQGLVIDEAHMFRNPEAKQTQALMRVASLVPQVLPMTGTPIYNRVGDLFPLLVATKQMRKEDHWFFLERYCHGQKVLKKRQGKNIFGITADGLTHADELREFLSPLILRRNREEIGRELPPLTRTLLPLDLSNTETYRQESSEIRQWIRHFAEGAPMETRMIQINKLRRLSAIGKVAGVRDRLQLLLDAEEKVVVLCSFLAPLDTLQKSFPESIRIDGNQSTQQRHRAAKRFQSDPRIRVAFCSAEAGGVAVTLTAAHHSMIMDLPWTPAQLQQMEARTYRETQQEPTQILYPIGRHTIDEKMFSILSRKANWTRQVFEGGDDGFVDVLVELENAIVQEAP